MFRILKRPNFWIVFLGDAVLVSLSLYIAYLLRFDGSIPSTYFHAFERIIFWVIPLKLACFYFFGLYKGMWRTN